MSTSLTRTAWNCRDRPAELLPLVRVGEREVVSSPAPGRRPSRRRRCGRRRGSGGTAGSPRRAGRAGSPPGTSHAWKPSSRVSEARQPSFCIGAEISSRASRSGRSDVRDLVVAGDGRDRDAGRDVGPGVRDEDLRAVDHPLAVLEPAVVRVAPASEPAPGSVSPNAASFRPDARSGSQSRFCSSEPKK